ncbi:phosphatidylglycerol lysyltransferase domain-containing protein [Kineococcus sp. LSe6-4]|uniref:Phosphatidylglycerol lysyltransferase domain-containing protein n=1 Tax=Kineococcus halophytocola TaxID=3234027 RepID=A0ABV4H1U8_9ACTN
MGDQTGGTGDRADLERGWRPRAVSSRWRSSWSASVVTVLYTVSGVLSVLMGLSPALVDRALRLPEVLTSWLFLLGWPSLGYGTLLLLLARSLHRRKRAAWRVLAVLVTANAVVGLGVALRAEDGSPWGAVVQLLLLAVVLHARPQFTVRGDPADVRAAAAVLAVLLVGCLVLGSTLVVVLDAGDAPVWHDVVFTVGTALLSVDLPLPVPLDVDVPSWVVVVLNASGTLALVVAAYVLFRPRRGVAVLAPEDEDRLRDLLSRYGARDSLGYFALRRDKTVTFSATGSAAVVHRVVGGVALASGDPIGAVAAWPGAIEAWRQQVREHGWTPAVLGASEEGATAYGRYGLDALEMGDEAVLDVATFSLEGRAVRGLRQTKGKVARAGYTVRVRRQAELDATETARLAALVDQWRAGEVERGFSMALGRVGDPGDGDLLVAECLTPQGQTCAVLTFVPWGGDGLSLDLMRRDRSVEVNGLTEFTVLEVLARGADLGVRRVSLNFAVFRSVFDRGSRLGSGPVLRLWYRLLVFGSRWWQLESLYRSNVKYRPEWFPRFLCFAAVGDLARIGVAAARAEGFVTWRR